MSICVRFRVWKFRWSVSLNCTFNDNGRILIFIAHSHCQTGLRIFWISFWLPGTNSALIEKSSLIPGESDHDGIPVIVVNSKPKVIKQKPRKVYSYHKADVSSIKSDLNTSVPILPPRIIQFALLMTCTLNLKIQSKTSLMPMYQLAWSVRRTWPLVSTKVLSGAVEGNRGHTIVGGEDQPKTPLKIFKLIVKKLTEKPRNHTGSKRSWESIIFFNVKYSQFMV